MSPPLLGVYIKRTGSTFESFGALERHAKNQISTIAGLQMIRGKISHKERQFWKAVHYGCKVSE